MKNVKLTIVGGLLAGVLIVPGLPAIADDHGHRHIPPGHLPPAGMCRIWYPGTPPGHQPPPGDCRTLSHRVPRGALLISRDRAWTYEERPAYYWEKHYVNRPDWHRDHRSPPYVYDGRRYSRNGEIRQDMRDVRDARQDLRQDRQQLEKNRDELKKDRAELRRDIRDGASRKEIRGDRKEIREDRQKIAENKKDVRESRNKLDDARDELRDDLHRR
jgi:hypothetical protein